MLLILRSRDQYDLKPLCPLKVNRTNIDTSQNCNLSNVYLVPESRTFLPNKWGSTVRLRYKQTTHTQFICAYFAYTVEPHFFELAGETKNCSK